MPESRGGQDAQPLLPTTKTILCGTGILPVFDKIPTSTIALLKQAGDRTLINSPPKLIDRIEN
ncbi:hypothetical protein QUA43_15410 [Microcoleus sp. N9_B4]